jgi:hypothetical protein
MLAVDKVTNMGVEKITAPIQTESAGNMSNIVEEAIFIAFQNAKTGIIEVLR